MTSKPLQNNLAFPMQRGPFQGNGASPWYCTLKLGTPAQSLKFSLDTGTNMSWVTSTLCPADQCKHFAGGRFDIQASSTFAFTDCLRRPYGFGPWGTMQVESACDVLILPNDARLDSQLFLAAAYEGDQFKQLDWDGGLGLPCSSAYVEGRSSFVLQALMREGQLDPTQPFVAFDWDASTRTGSCQMGAVDNAKTQGPHLFLPWSVYSELPGVEYIWSTELTSYSVGSEKLRTNIKFALDSGSSQFKGDNALMRETLARIAHSDQPDILLEFADGQITLGSELYNCLIEAGPEKGQVLPQFAPMGLADLVVVGSLIMEHCYTVYEYQVVKCSHEVYSLAPVGIWLFNRADGPQIITRSSSKPFMPGARAVLETKVTLPGPSIGATTVAGTWANDYGSVMTLEVSGRQVTGTYRSSTGSTGEYSIAGCLSGTAATRAKSQALALAIEWHDLGDAKKDPSWHWASGLSGQLSVTDKGDVLTLNHLLVATSDFPELARQGTYIDKLVYTRAEQQTPIRTSAESDPMSIENTLAGYWVAAGGTFLMLSVHSDSMKRFGIVQGFFRNQDVSAEVTGFTDINAQESNLSLQSVSLTIATDRDNTVRAVCGALDLMADTLSLLILASSPVAPAHAYLATQISSLHFTRLPVPSPATTG
ncbi:Avidin family protein [Pseudomonas cedrina]|uniref:Peptidase A1 pepsin n=2 Tax=Pseudomonas cedrina TaxID=651740 RepID=A0A1V2K0D7_PSECE|nr:avidin/streptavidin family protein [Pseudomonas cedrina]ONH51168.1 peptidase A1 pepsin [Pseudomonas cedrina subsp. cedrina]SDS79867.1 Avidin family protein [Pseudomonas cedrina]